MSSASQRRPGVATARLAAFAVLAGFSLAGCVETTAEMAPGAAVQHLYLARRHDVSLADATVAFVSLDSPSSEISASFMKDLGREAAAQDVVVADAKKAHYFVRGYLSAYLTQDGAAIQYVWDIFTKDKARTQRLSDYLLVKGEGADPWAIAGEAALASVAAKSADDLAAFLSNTPEAIAKAAPSPSSDGAMSALDAAKPLAYAPAE